MERSTASFLAASVGKFPFSTFRIKCIPPLRSNPRLMRLLMGISEAKQPAITARMRKNLLRKLGLINEPFYRTGGITPPLHLLFNNLWFYAVGFDQNNNFFIKFN